MKTDIAWSSSIEIGIDRIDLEHKIFVDLIKNFEKETTNGISEERHMLLILEIEKYAEFHFISEENFMQLIDYPKLEEHKELHFRLLEKLNVVKHRGLSADEFLKFVVSWFIHHTTQEDKQVAKYCNEQNLNIDYTFSL